MPRIEIPETARFEIPVDIGRTFVNPRVRRCAQMAFSRALIGDLTHLARYLGRKQESHELTAAEVRGIMNILARHGARIVDRTDWSTAPLDDIAALLNKRRGPLANLARNYYQFGLRGWRIAHFREMRRTRVLWPHTTT